MLSWKSTWKQSSKQKQITSIRYIASNHIYPPFVETNALEQLAIYEQFITKDENIFDLSSIKQIQIDWV